MAENEYGIHLIMHVQLPTEVSGERKVNQFLLHKRATSSA